MVRRQNPFGDEIFLIRPDRSWSPTQPPTRWVYRVFPGGKRAAAWRWPPTLFSAEVKERVELHLYSPSGPSWPVLGWFLPLLYSEICFALQINLFAFSYKSISHHFLFFAMDCRQNSHFSGECFFAFSVASRNSFVLVSIYSSNCVTSYSQNTIHTLPACLWTQKEYLCKDLRFRIPNYIASVMVRFSVLSCSQLPLVSFRITLLISKFEYTASWWKL